MLYDARIEEVIAPRGMLASSAASDTARNR